MNLSSTPPLIRPPARRQWLWVGLGLLMLLFVVLGVVALGVGSYFRLSSDTRALRNGLMKASGVEWRRQIDLNLGRMTLGVVGAGLAFVPLDANARAAVQAVRGVEVGIYEVSPGMKPPDRVAMLANAETVLTARGWERLVGVLEGENLVSVYVPGKAISVHQVQCCALVFDGRQMVVVSARVDAEPLLRCMRKQFNLRDKMQSLAAR